MKKGFSMANLVFIFLLPVVVQVHGLLSFDLKPEFSHDSEASKFSQITQQFSLKTPLNSDETFLFSDYETDSNPSFPEYEFPQGSLQVQNLPFETTQSSEYGFSKDFEPSDEPFEIQQISYQIDSHHKIRLPPPSPCPANVCEYKCSIKCLKENFPLLLNLCNNVCRSGCFFNYSELIFHCTDHCAVLMPQQFKSNEKEAAGYLKYCYKKCIKVF